MNKKQEEILKIELAREAIDGAIDKWLQLNGIKEDKIMELDFSYIDEELSALIG